jgi:hypothetical protein
MPSKKHAHLHFLLLLLLSGPPVACLVLNSQVVGLYTMQALVNHEGSSFEPRNGTAFLGALITL